MRGIAALLRPMGRLAAMLQQAQGARTLAGGGPEGLEDTKRERRRRRRKTNLRLKEIVNNHDLFWGADRGQASKRRRGRAQAAQPSSAEGVSEEYDDDEVVMDAELLEFLLSCTRGSSRTQQQRLRQAWRKRQRAAAAQQRRRKGPDAWEEAEWSFGDEFFWGAGARERRSGQQAHTFRWEDLFGAEATGWWGCHSRGGGSSRGHQWGWHWEEAAWEESRRSRRHRQRSDRAGFADTAQHAASTEVASSLRILGLQQDAPLTADALKAAFRRCALRYHPDLHQNGAKAEAERKFKDAQSAYQLLLDLL